MIILCDTSSIFLLLRIAPEMFIDPRYECVTLPAIYNEVFRTQKFKEKYPWRTSYKSKIKPMIPSHYQTSKFTIFHKNIQFIVDAGVIDQRTGKLFNLSEEDCTLAACALANEFEISSGDTGLVAFVDQEYPDLFKGNLSALDVINRWIENGVLIWNDEKQAFLEEWIKNKEACQPKAAVKRFIKLTKRNYPGS